MQIFAFLAVLGDPCEKVIEPPKGQDPQGENHWLSGSHIKPAGSGPPFIRFSLTVPPGHPVSLKVS